MTPATIRRHAIAAAMQHIGHITIRGRLLHSSNHSRLETGMNSMSSTPFWVKDQKPGTPVTVKEAELFDYISAKPEGSQESNETGNN